VSKSQGFFFLELKGQEYIQAVLSQQELADRIDVSRQTINAIEKEDYNPTMNLCIAICKALGKTLDELFWKAL